MSVTIGEPGAEDAEQLAAILCEDSVLRGELGILADDRPTGASVLQKLTEWCLPRRATTFAILVDGTAVGTISLSHRSQGGLTARIGCWVGSAHRRKGYCKQAFAAVLARAESEGILSVWDEGLDAADLRHYVAVRPRHVAVPGLGIGGGLR